MAELETYMTPVFRASFPNVFKARSVDDGPEKFGLSAIWTPSKFSDSDKIKWKKMMKALDEASMTAFKKHWKDLPDNIKKGVRNGNEKSDMEGYGEGTRFANLTSNMRPGVVDRDRNVISHEEGNTELIYPGCYCRAKVNAYSYAKKGKGVALGLMSLQFVADGERLDSRSNAAEDFADDDIEDVWLEDDDIGGADEEDFGDDGF